MAKIDQYLQKTIEYGGSDLHICVDRPPLIRLKGALVPLIKQPLNVRQTRTLIMEVLDPTQRQGLLARAEVDFTYKMGPSQRFRCIGYRQRAGMDAVFHVIPNAIPPLASLGLPEVAYEFCKLNQGLVLVTGPRGCGKSTTQASLLDYINETARRHIITLEDPIEFLHSNKQSLVNQREVGRHALSFASALRQSLRADPDIILVGEMRDLETISMAITAAETGHLVLGTLHTVSAVQTIDRIVDIFPGTQKLQIRQMVSESLRGIICQQLIPDLGGQRMEVAVEILVGIGSIANLIRDGKTYQIPSIMQMSNHMGMQLMDDALVRLLRHRSISYQDAIIRAVDKKKFMEFARAR
ncbi:PilT/PilU family type 4a pilus ATPase [bacterium]|nr:PilT/PilU family type 4a pilus ATPase [candidate division CSSED10-310 bacterium]